MKRSKPWLVVSAVIILCFLSRTGALQPFRKPSISTSSSSTTTTTTETSTSEEDDGKSENSTLSAAAAAAKAKNSKLTGIPQIDYIWDPNLPRELRGYNLSNYPFYASTPAEEDITFKCEGHHDGFYASIEHKCQVYHHCVYGIRHDFLCANFTAFDQKTFICHFVSDVDCENSYKYWNRNDDLYMATTTTSTTTTTTEPPPTPRRRPISRPLRPLRRPVNRRPLDDYYYEDVVYDDEYYEEKPNRRRKQRPRQRKPALIEYEDEYEDESHPLVNEDQPRRTSSRDRYPTNEEILEEDYDVPHRKYDRPRLHSKPTSQPNDKSRPNSRKIGSINERRSFGDDSALAGRDDIARPVGDIESQDLLPRRSNGRRPIAQKRPINPASYDAYGEEEEGESYYEGNSGGNNGGVPKEKLNSKPPEELITPKSAAASVYSRPRAPPRIARPVPVNEKKKFQYPIQKPNATTALPVASVEDEEYYEEELEYEKPISQTIGNQRRRLHEEDDVSYPQAPSRQRNGHEEIPLAISGKKPLRSSLRKPLTNKKQPIVEEGPEYDSTGSASNERFDRHHNPGRRPVRNRNRAAFSSEGGAADDIDFVDDDYEERPLKPTLRRRPNKGTRRNIKKPRPLVEEEEENLDELEPEKSVRTRPDAKTVTRRRKNSATSQRRRPSTPTSPPETDAEPDPAEDIAIDDREQEEGAVYGKVSTSTLSLGRQNSVRIVKRPFLPSRGGSPYLPRGLQPVGVAVKPNNMHSTDTPSNLDMGATLSGIRLLEHGAPILRETAPDRDPEKPAISDPVVTHARDTIPLPKATLDQLYEEDYDVTLNDALNPTLKPLTSQQHHIPNRSYPSVFAHSPNAFVNNAQTFLTHPNNNFQYQETSQSHQPALLSAQSETDPLISSQQQQQHRSHQHQRG